VSRAVMIDFDPYISTPVVAEALGGTTPVEFGMQSGPILVERRAAELGIEIEPDDLSAVVAGIQAELAATKSRIDDERFAELIRQNHGERSDGSAQVTV
jgi:hypothetical protein